MVAISLHLLWLISNTTKGPTTSEFLQLLRTSAKFLQSAFFAILYQAFRDALHSLCLAVASLIVPSLDRNSTFILRRRSQWASVPPFQLLQVAPRFCKKRTSNWSYNFRRIKQLVKGPPGARVHRASAISAEGKRAKIMLFFAINDLESTQLERP